jgi:hypothetical protein
MHYSVLMAKLNVYVPDVLAAQVRASGLNVSQVCQRALRQALLDTIEPCTGEIWVGRFLHDWCGKCHHVLAVHMEDSVCSVCVAIAALGSAD